MKEKLYEYNDIGGAVIPAYLSGSKWWGQTITIGNVGTNEDHYLTALKITFQKNSNPNGDCTISVRNVDGDGLPTGDDLTSTSLSCSDFPTDNNVSTKLEFDNNIKLKKDTSYAFIFRAPEADTSNNLNIAYKPADYGGGCLLESSDDGESWSKVDEGVSDTEFWEYGTVGYETKFIKVPGKKIKFNKVSNKGFKIG